MGKLTAINITLSFYSTFVFLVFCIMKSALTAAMHIIVNQLALQYIVVLQYKVFDRMINSNQCCSNDTKVISNVFDYIFNLLNYF